MAYGSMVKSMGELKLEDKQQSCPDCGCREFDVKGEELFCKKCGLVMD